MSVESEPEKQASPAMIFVIGVMLLFAIITGWNQKPTPVNEAEEYRQINEVEQSKRNGAIMHEQKKRQYGR